MRVARALLALVLAACGAHGSPRPSPTPEPQPLGSAVGAVEASVRRTVTIIGTSDLHGHVEALPTLGGYLAILRELRGDGGVLLVDAGDLFQGTLASNLGEGAAVVKGYNALRYDAVAVGNHEFDFGPVGPNASPSSPTEDPRGALTARVAESGFLWLSANVSNGHDDVFAKPKNLVKRAIVEKSGVRIGLVGVTSEDTLRTTLAANVSDLSIAPLARTIVEQSALLREANASVVLVLAHAGGRCTSFGNPDDAASCAPTEEIMRVLDALPSGTIDGVVAGHTHQAMAHRVRGVPVIQSYANGRAFGRMDVTMRGTKVEGVQVFPPHDLTPSGMYEGRAVVTDVAVARSFDADIARADQKRRESLGVRLSATFAKAYDDESALGDLFADLLKGAVTKSDVALVNGGGLRSDLAAGELTYGALFEAMPFDNRIARVAMTGGELRELFARNVAGSHGILDVAGVAVTAHCDGRRLAIELRRLGATGQLGSVVKDSDALVVVMSDFLATGGDGVVVSKDRIHIDDDTVRDVLEREIKKRKELDPTRSFDPKSPRLRYPAARPVRCDG